MYFNKCFKFFCPLILFTLSACFFSKNIDDISESNVDNKTKTARLLRSIKCSWTKEGDFIESVPQNVKVCHDEFVENWNDKSTEKMMQITNKYSNCLFSIIKDFQQRFYSTKINYFDSELLTKSAKNIESLYYRIYCRASLCNDEWKVIASGDSAKIYEDFLKNMYAIIMADLSGDEHSCKDKRNILQKEMEGYFF